MGSVPHTLHCVAAFDCLRCEGLTHSRRAPNSQISILTCSLVHCSHLHGLLCFSGLLGVSFQFSILCKVSMGYFQAISRSSGAISPYHNSFKARVSMDFMSIATKAANDARNCFQCK